MFRSHFIKNFYKHCNISGFENSILERFIQFGQFTGVKKLFGISPKRFLYFILQKPLYSIFVQSNLYLFPAKLSRQYFTDYQPVWQFLTRCFSSSASSTVFENTLDFLSFTFTYSPTSHFHFKTLFLAAQFCYLLHQHSKDIVRSSKLLQSP